MRFATLVRSAALCIVAAAGVAPGAGGFRGTDPGDPLAAFGPPKRVQIESGTAVVEVLRAHDDDLAVVGAAKTTADTGRLVVWSREIEELQRGKYVPFIQRFSTSPKIEDLSALVLDDEDLEDLKDCRPGRCGVMLAAHEIQQMSAAIASAGRAWRRVAEETFRAIMLARAQAYLAGGQGAVPLYEDQKRPVDPAVERRSLLDRCAEDVLFTGRLANYLHTFPHDRSNVESFLYWSKELLGDVKPIISITHLSIFPASGDEPAMVVSSQVFATHYVRASLSLTAVVSRPGDDGRYLVYLRRSRVDVFRKTFGGFIRRMVQKRVRAEGPPALEALRTKLEGGPPRLTPLTRGPS